MRQIVFMVLDGAVYISLLSSPGKPNGVTAAFCFVRQCSSFLNQITLKTYSVFEYIGQVSYTTRSTHHVHIKINIAHNDHKCSSQ